MSGKSKFRNTLDYWFAKARKNAIKRPNSRQKRRDECKENAPTHNLRVYDTIIGYNKMRTKNV